MVNNHDNRHRISTILFRESLWNIEDNVKNILEGVADHEAELIRLRHAIETLARRLEKSDTEETLSAQEVINGRD